MSVMSSAGFWMPLFAGCAVALAAFGGFRGRAFVLLGLVCLVVNDSGIANTLKHALHRPRPWQALDGVRQVDLARVHPQVIGLWKPLRISYSHHVADVGAGRSLPSAHTINTMTFALLAALFYRRAEFLAIPVIVGWSRIYVGSHWPSDVAVSLFLGAGSTLVMAALAEAAWRRLGARWLPRLQDRHPFLFSK